MRTQKMKKIIHEGNNGISLFWREIPLKEISFVSAPAASMPPDIWVDTGSTAELYIRLSEIFSGIGLIKGSFPAFALFENSSGSASNSISSATMSGTSSNSRDCSDSV